MKKSVYRRLDQITPGETDQIDIDGVIHKDGKVDDQYIDIEKHPDPTYAGTEIDSLSDAYNLFWSAGVTSGGDISFDSGSNTITVTSAQGVLRENDTNDSTLYSVTIPQKTFSVGSGLDVEYDTEYFVSADFDNGPGSTPTFIIDTTNSTINCRNNCLLYTIFVDSSSNSLLTLDGKAQNVDGNARIRRRIFRINRLERAANGSLVSGLSGTRRWQLSAGTIFFGLSPINHKSFNTSGSDTFTYYYQDGSGGFIAQSGQQNINNLKYDDGSGTLATLVDDAPPPTGTGQSFGLHWLYLILNSNSLDGGRLAVVYGNDSYPSISEAQSTAQPSELPEIINTTGILLGRAIIEKGNTEIDLVESVFRPTFVGTNAQQHNNLAGLQGGSTNLYEHSDQPINQINQPQWSRVLSQFSNSGLTATGDPSLPGFSFYGDEDTGMYRSSTNQLSFATAGTEQLNVSPTGKVDLLSDSALVLNRGTTSTRPVGENGMIRYNEDTDLLEFYSNEWVSISKVAGEGDFVSRSGDTMTGNLEVTNGADGVVISKNGGLEITGTGTSPSAYLDLKNNSSDNFDSRIALKNNGLDIHVAGKSSPDVKITSGGDIIPGSNLDGNVGTTTNTWLNVYSRRFLANNNGGGSSLASYSFIADSQTGMFRTTGGNLGFLVSGSNQLDVSNSGIISLNNSSGALKLNSGTTAQRPSSPQDGYIRFNEDSNDVEFYANGSWASFSSGSGNFVQKSGDTMTGTLLFSGVTNSINAGSGYIINVQDPTTDPLKLSPTSSENTRLGDLAYNDQRYLKITGGTIQGDITASKFIADSGTESSPSFTFSGDQNTGIFNPLADELSVATGGQEVVNINSGIVSLEDPTGALKLNSGTTAQRPSTPENGFLRYNEDTDTLEVFANGIWADVVQNSDDFVLSSGDTMTGGLTFSSGVSVPINAGTGYIINVQDPTVDPLEISPTSTENTRIADLEYNDQRYIKTTGDTLQGNLTTSSGTQFLADSGTINNPSYSFSGDNDTGVYSPGADQISLVAGGQEIVSVDDTGMTVSGNVTFQNDVTFNKNYWNDSENSSLQEFTLAENSYADFDVQTIFNTGIQADDVMVELTVLDNSGGTTDGFYIKNDSVSTVAKQNELVRVVNEDSSSNDFKMLMINTGANVSQNDGTVTSLAPSQTSITSPTDGATDVSTTPTITTASYSGTGTHSFSQYQIATDTGFTSLAYDSGDVTDLTSHTVPGGSELSEGTQYYIRARHKNDSGFYGPWSSTVGVTTESANVSTFVVVGAAFTSSSPNVAKFDLQGNLQTDNTISSQSIVYGLVADDNENIYSSTGNDEVIKLDSNLNTVWTFTGFNNPVRTVAVDTSGNVYGGGADNTVKKLDSSGNEVWTFSGHSSTVRSVAVDTNGNVYSGSNDITVKKIDSSGNEVWSFSGHTNTVYAVAVDTSGNVYSGSQDNTVKKIDSNGNEVWTFSGHTGIVYTIAVDTNGNVYSGSGDTTVKKIDSSGNEVWTFSGHTSAVFGIGIDTDGFIYTTSFDDTLRKLDSNGNEIFSVSATLGGARSLAVTPGKIGAGF